MKHKVDNAIIMAAGTSSRFAPLSYEKPKALVEVRGEVLLERQICQLKEAGIDDIIIVVGYKKEQFEYLTTKYGVKLIENKEYLTRNNNSSIYAVKDYIGNSYICSADNYFSKNPFENSVDAAYYAAVFSEGDTKEWCMSEGEDGFINSVVIGGNHAWYMLGHTFWDRDFSNKFIDILNDIYEKPETKDLLWESIFMMHLDELKMKIRKYPENFIFEFDTLDELREFDTTYVENTRSQILKAAAKELNCEEKNIREVAAFKDGSNVAAGCRFKVFNQHFEYNYKTKNLRRM